MFDKLEAAAVDLEDEFSKLRGKHLKLGTLDATLETELRNLLATNSKAIELLEGMRQKDLEMLDLSIKSSLNEIN